MPFGFFTWDGKWNIVFVPTFDPSRLDSIGSIAYAMSNNSCEQRIYVTLAQCIQKKLAALDMGDSIS